MTSSIAQCRLALQRDDFELRADFELPASGITGLFGPSGSGKSTVLRCLAGLEKDVTGSISIAGENWQDSEQGVFVPPHRRDVGYVFQGARLFPHLDVAGNIDYGARRTARAPQFERSYLVDLLRLQRLLHRRPAGLSGGEQQRVAIARALMRSPRLLLMDEPLTGLDTDSRRELMPFLDRLHLELNIPVLYVTHGVDEITHLADHLIMMRAGRVIETGEMAQLMHKPDIFGEEECGALLPARVVDSDPADQLTRVQFDDGHLWVPGDLGQPGDKLRLKILARDVSISRQIPLQSSILNHLPATVTQVTDRGGPYVQIVLLAGKSRIFARVSRRSLAELGLVEGLDVIAQVKAVAVKPAGTFRETL